MVIEDNENQLGHPRRGKVSMEIPLILEERVQCEGEVTSAGRGVFRQVGNMGR